MEPETNRYELEYIEVGNRRRHYSAVRSALTSFLMTVSLAAFVRYGESPSSGFAPFVGHLMLLFAGFTCLAFSYRGEKAAQYRMILWQWLGDPTQPEPGDFDSFSPDREAILEEMLRDEMNWVMFIAVVAIVLGFWLTA